MYEKKVFFLVAVLSFTVVIRGQEIDSIVIRYTDMWTVTSKSIPCSDFCVSIYQDANRAVITENIKIKEFMDALNLLPYNAVNNYIDSISPIHYMHSPKCKIDARAKIYIYYNDCNCTTLICMDLFRLQSGDECFVYTDKFIRVLNQYIPKEFLLKYRFGFVLNE